MLRVRDKFHLTLELDPRYALVANTLAWLNADGDEQGALVTGYEADILLQHCQTFWPKTAEVPARAAFEALLEEMFDLGVLGRVRIENTKRFRYCLASGRWRRCSDRKTTSSARSAGSRSATRASPTTGRSTGASMRRAMGAIRRCTTPTCR